MGAPLSHGPWKPSPSPAWQWQSMIMGALVEALLGGLILLIVFLAAALVGLLLHAHAVAHGAEEATAIAAATRASVPDPAAGATAPATEAPAAPGAPFVFLFPFFLALRLAAVAARHVGGEVVGEVYGL